jgi:hypothetical protein
MSPTSNRYLESILAREREGVDNVTGFCTAHDESGPPINHRIPNFANLVMAWVTRKNDLAPYLSPKSLGCLFGYGFSAPIFNWSAELLECNGVRARGDAAGWHFA